jgi:hypothetical protein
MKFTNQIGRSSLTVVLVSLFLSTVGYADSLDIFPLREGIQYTYVYEDSMSYDIYGHYATKTVGTVTYLVLDSVVVGDSLIRWTVRQDRNLITTWITPSNPPELIVDSYTFRVDESLNGNHSLTCSSLLWDFPRMTYRTGWVLDSAYRYCDSTPSIFVHRRNCLSSPYPTSFDSIWFSADSGIHRMRWDRCFDLPDMFGGVNIGDAELISLIVLPVRELSALPSTTRLLPSYPNPFNGATTITYEVSRTTVLSLAVYDISGRVISSIDGGEKTPGVYRVVFDAMGLSSGIYLVRLNTPQGSQVQRTLYLR